jgi:hypothetical protein
VGFLEIINNDNSDAKDVVTDQEQLLFDDFWGVAFAIRWHIA